MTILNSDGEIISFESAAPQVESYDWVPKEMLIMISSRDVVIMIGTKKWNLTHAKYAKFKKDLQEKWDAENQSKRQHQETSKQEEAEGIEAPSQECAQALSSEANSPVH